MLIRLLIMVLLVVLFWAWARRFDIARKTQSYVPGRFQLVGEIGLNFVRKNIAHETLGQKDGDRFLPLLTTIFFTVLAMNLTGLIPGLNIAATSVIGLPLVMVCQLRCISW
jgi:F-type H+-transporting ATPase subunit a